jgi:hypothetical protein
MFNWARRSPVLTDGDRKVVHEAAELFAQLGDFGGAGECYEFVGEDLLAAEAYQKGGEVDRLESVLQRDENRRKRTYKVTDAFEEYRLQMSRGERDLALISIRTCVDSAAEADRAAYVAAQRELEERLLTDGSVLLRATQPQLFVGSFPVHLGREQTNQIALRDGGVSRQHARIDAAAGGYSLTDLGSKNGTLLGGVRLIAGGTLPLPPSGELGIGEHCAFQFRADEAALRLSVVAGLDRGLQVLCSSAPMDIAGRMELSFRGGRPNLRARVGNLILNGVQCAQVVQLCRRDIIELDELRFEVA